MPTTKTLWTFIGSAENRTRDSWVRSANATSVQCYYLQLIYVLLLGCLIMVVLANLASCLMTKWSRGQSQLTLGHQTHVLTDFLNSFSECPNTEQI